MVKVTEMIGDYAEPLGIEGYSVDHDVAVRIAGEMREMLDAIYKFNCVCDSDEMLAAWMHLNAMERAAWRKCVEARGRHVDK